MASNDGELELGTHSQVIDYHFETYDLDVLLHRVHRNAKKYGAPVELRMTFWEDEDGAAYEEDEICTIDVNGRVIYDMYLAYRHPKLVARLDKIIAKSSFLFMEKANGK